MENAVIYARYSSTGQNEQSIDGQVRICKEFAESKGYNVVKVYIDKAKSAWSDSEKRHDFQRMLNEARTKAFQHIIVYKFDRFCRNRLESQMFKQRLKKEFGIRVQSATEPVSDDEGGEIYEMFLEWNDEKYSQRLSKRVRDGFDTSVAKGNFTGGVVIWGYKLVKEPIPNKPNSFTSRIIIDENIAPTIKFIFEEYARGTDKKEIAKVLNEKGIRFNGKQFKGRMFDHWLNNTKYYGHFTFGERSNGSIYPAIIDKATFDRVQARLKENRYFTRTNHTPEKYLLTGRIFCGYCGCLMTADGSNKVHAGKEVLYRYYGCKTARKNKCKKKLEQKDRIEKYVIDRMFEFLKDENNILKIADYLVKHYEQRTDETAIKSLDTRIQHTETQIETTTNAFIEAVAMKNDILKKSCDTKIIELNTFLDDLKRERAKLLLEQSIPATRKEIIAFLQEVLVKNENENEQDYHKRLVESVVRCVYVWDDMFVIWFNILDNIDYDLPSHTKSREIAEQTGTIIANKKGTESSAPDTSGGGGEIRTPVSLRTNGFQVFSTVSQNYKNFSTFY